MGSGGFGLGDGGPSRWERWKQNRELRKYQEAFSRESQRGSRGSYSGGGFSSYTPSIGDNAGKIFVFLFFVVLPVFGIYWETSGAESCRGRAATRAAKEERKAQEREHKENEPKYARQISNDAVVLGDSGNIIKVKIGDSIHYFDRSPLCGNYRSGKKCLVDEYPNFIVVSEFGEEITIPRRRAAQADAGTKAPQSRPAAQEAGPGPSSREAENEASEFIAKKYKEYGERCIKKPVGKIDFARCDRIEASLSVAFSVLHEDRCKGSAQKDEEKQKYCDFIRQQMKQPIPKGISPRRPLKHFQ